LSFSHADRPTIDWILTNMDSLSRPQVETELAKVGHDPARIEQLWDAARYERSVIDWILANEDSPTGWIEIELAKTGLDPVTIERLQNAARQMRVADPATHALLRATTGWTSPFVIRTYESTQEGEKRFAWEAAVLARHDYQPTMQSAEGSHLHAGRLLLTGGLTIFAGRRGTRSQGKLSVTYQKVAQTPAATQTPSPAPVDPTDQLRKLAELRDAGILTVEEFDAKKAEILSRM
jgi:hypothetical protein